MKTRIVRVSLLLVFLVAFTTNTQAASTVSSEQLALIYVKIDSAGDLNRFASTQLPIFIQLESGVLTSGDRDDQYNLRQVGLTYQVIDTSIGAGSYYLASEAPGHPTPDYAKYGRVLLDTTDGILLHMDAFKVKALTQAGAELSLITLTPKPFPASQSDTVYPDSVEPNPIIQGMMDQVSETQVYNYDRQLAGELPVLVDGDWYTIPTRYTYSGTPIQKTTSYVGQHMSNDLGLEVEYYQWKYATNPDVIGEITGSINPHDIFIIGAHIDDVGGAPGADDNGSGSAATLIASDILSQFQWGCTLRFAFWTGEEQGLLGSHAYAQRAYANGEKILGYLNLDMIAWNTPASSPTIYLGYGSSVPRSQNLANLFAQVVNAYNINLIPTIGTNYSNRSDHGSFLAYGYPAMLGIEGDDDFNPYYHTYNDTSTHTDPTYFTNYVKASIGTYAHMSNCLIPEGSGYLIGHVTTTDGGVPIEGAMVSTDDSQGHTHTATTDSNGYYTLILPAGSYTIAVSAYDFHSATMEGIKVEANKGTTQDVVLVPVCHPVSGLDFSWTPLFLFKGDLITFTATASGSPPIDYQWDFGDTNTSTGKTVSHAYVIGGDYTVSLSAANACGGEAVNKDIAVSLNKFVIILPWILR
jgi:hypothetical protein